MNPQLAIENARKATIISPKFMLPYVIQLFAYSIMGFPDTSALECERIIRMDSSYSFMAYSGVALGYYRSGQLFSALRYFRKIMQFNNQLTDKNRQRDNLVVVGFGCYHMNYYTQAISYFKKANKFIPDDPNTLFLLSWCYALKHRNAKALKYLEKSLAAGLDDKEGIHHLGEVNQMNKKVKYRKILTRYFNGI